MCRDLKLDNTLLDGSHPPRVKLCDFGFAKCFQKGDANMFTLIGCARTAAFQLLSFEQRRRACRNTRTLYGSRFMHEAECGPA